MIKNQKDVGDEAVWVGPNKPSNLKNGNQRYGMDPIHVFTAP